MFNRRTWRQPGLLSRILLFVCTPLLAFLGLLGLFLFWRLEVWAEKRLQEDVQLVARTLQAPMSHALERRRQGSVEFSLESVLDIGRVYGARVFDENGRLIASSLGEEKDAEIAEFADFAETSDFALDELDRRTGEYGEMEGRSVYSYFVPLSNSDGESIGLLQISRLHREMLDQLAQFRFVAGLIFLLSGVGTLGIVLIGYRSAVGRSLARLRSAMVRIEEGERSHRAATDGPPEIATLAASLNRMLDSIDRAEGEIRERRRSELSLQKKLHKTENLAALGQVAAGVAHELGGPLSVVDGNAQRALRKNPAPESRKTLEAIREEVQRMADIVRELLEFGRTHDNPRRPIRVDHLVNSVLHSIENDGSAGQGRIHREGDEPVPVVSVNRIRLELAITNLVKNALHAARDGNVFVSWIQRDGQAEITVEDDGPGLPAGAEERIFEPFFTTRAADGGSGLGLAIVHQVADECGGSVHASASRRGGAAFRITIPVAAVECPELAEAQS